MRSRNDRVVGRFAPSPTGRLHAGNIFSYLMAWLIVRSLDGSIVLRIEDLDPERSRRSFSDRIMTDLESLGLTWDTDPIFQSERTEIYEQALQKLNKAHLLYSCYCTRADLRSASAPHPGERYVYSGHCKTLDGTEARKLEESGRKPASRLIVADETITFTDAIQGSYSQNLKEECGDFIVRRADGAFAYQLAVVIDDAACGITSVVRGVDLLDSTPQQIYLQKIFNFDQPEYAHVPLFTDESGRRLSKRNKDADLEMMLTRFKDPRAVIGHIAYLAGLIDADEPASPDEILKSLKDTDIKERLTSTKSILWR